MYFLQKLKTDLVKEAAKIIGAEVQASDFEYPSRDASRADLSLPCFKYAKELKKSPVEIAENISASIKNKWLEKAEPHGAYVNFYLKRSAVAEEILNVESSTLHIGKGEKLMLEYVSPNSNKPLHLGHARNGFLGEALANILDFSGYKIKRSCLINDRGVAICKAMLAYKLWGKGDSPKKSGLKSDHFVGKYYVMFEMKSREDKALLDEVRAMLVKWENGDQETVKLWKKITKWALDGYEETYARLGIKFDKTYRESELYKEGRDLVTAGLEKKIFKKDEKGNIFADLEKCNLPNKIVLRGDGTAIYATTDLILAKKRFEDGYKKIVYAVGQEQDLYFKQLFCILEQMNLFKGKDTFLKHLSYGLVELPEGKMKSREGTVVDIDDLLSKLEKMTAAEVKKRYPDLRPHESEKRSKIIALAAIKFYILNVSPQSTIHFNPKESISFAGRTGPYILYSYARLHSIWRKGKSNPIYKDLDFALLQEDELWALVLDMAKFPEKLEHAAREFNPEEICGFLYDFSSNINEFYHKLPVLEADLPQRRLRIATIDSALKFLEQGLLLLGIKPLEEM